MKKLIGVTFLMFFVFVLTASAQQAEETVTVKKSDLTTDQLKKVEAQKITEQLGQYKDWADMGKGVGYAVRESLTAVKDVAVDFSKTDIGKFTIFLVAWKIMAKDVLATGDMIIGYIVGIPLLVGGLLVIVWSYRKQCVARSILIEKGSGFWIWREKKYAIYDPADHESKMEVGDWTLTHLISALVLIIICCLMMFVN